MKYNSILATDMDYTLLMPGKDVTPENARAVRALRENGVAFTLATGRSSFLVGKYAEDLGIDIPIITGNGGALYDPAAKRDLVSKDIPEAKFRELMETMLSRKIDATIYSVTGIYFSPLARDIIPTFNKFLLIAPPEDFVEELKADKSLTVVSSAPAFYDVMTADVSKGDALLELADYLGIPRENTFASGDSENDLTMLESAAYGIAMGDSAPNVISAASFVTSTCEEDGFARAVFEFVIPRAKSFT